MTTLLGLVFDFALLPVVALALVGHLGRFNWLAEMTNFFRLHLAGLALAMVALALAAGGELRLVASLLILAASAWPLVVPRLPVAKRAKGRSLRLLTANVLQQNRNYAALLHLVRSADPDIIALQETDEGWRRALVPLAADYPHAFVDHRSNSAVHVLSRFPMTAAPMPLRHEAEPRRLIGGGVPIRAEIAVPGITRPVVLYAIHPPTPRRPEGWRARNAYLDDVASRIAAEPRAASLVVAGDWNTPFWSPTLAGFLAATGLGTTERGPWPPPTRFFREIHAPAFLGTPIDRVAVSSGISLVSIAVGGDFGSDHLPVTVDLALN